MNRSIKSWIKWARVLQLVLRCLEFLASTGLLVMMILIRDVDEVTGWIIRVVPGVAILHTVYGLYHLSRKASGRTPASSASYMLFAAFFDASITPFYAFSALVAKTKQAAWTNIIDQAQMETFAKVVFYLATAGGGLYVASLILSLYLAIIFRKIVKLPPDMNPLEDHLTSRHKRNHSAISNSTDATEKRLSMPLESKRSSGAPYEDLSRPPSIPFFHTRSGSSDSLTACNLTPPPSRDSRLELPSRQYQIPPSPRSSVGSDMKRASYYGPSTTPKRGPYSGLPPSDTASQRQSRQSAPRTKNTEAWYTRDSLPKRDSLQKEDPLLEQDSLQNGRSRSSSPQKGYQPIHRRLNSWEDNDLPNPLEANPPTKRDSYCLSRDSPLSEISQNLNSSDIALSSRVREASPVREDFRAKYYGDLRPGTPPIMIGNNRQVSSGTDFKNLGGYKVDRRDVSGKIAEEGRGGEENGWGARFRRVSGL